MSVQHATQCIQQTLWVSWHHFSPHISLLQSLKAAPPACGAAPANAVKGAPSDGAIPPFKRILQHVNAAQSLHSVQVFCRLRQVGADCDRCKCTGCLPWSALGSLPNFGACPQCPFRQHKPSPHEAHEAHCTLFANLPVQFKPFCCEGTSFRLLQVPSPSSVAACPHFCHACSAPPEGTCCNTQRSLPTRFMPLLLHRCTCRQRPAQRRAGPPTSAA